MTSANRSKIRAAIESVRGHGVSCLNGIGGQAAASGARLRSHLNEAAPKTQVCCGATCTNRNFYPEGPAPTAAGRTSGRGDFGTIKIAGSTLAGSTDDLKATLFHEYLHRIGLCTHADHDAWADVGTRHDFIRRERSSGGCGSGYRRVSQFGRDCGGHACRPDETLAGQLRTAHSMHPTWFDAATFDAVVGLDAFCVRASGCEGGGTLDLRHPAVNDPVYACEAACYPNGLPSTVGGPTGAGARVCGGLANASGSWNGQSYCEF